MLARSAEIGHERDMDINRVSCADLVTDLTDSFEERLAFNVTRGAADFGDNNIRVTFLADVVYKFFYFICYVRNGLNGAAEIFSAAFLVDNV